MDNNRLNELRRAWLEDADDGAITSLLMDVMKASYRQARINCSVHDSQDVSVKTAHYVWAVLEEVQDWVVVTERYTNRLTTAITRSRKADNELKEAIVEYRKTPRVVASEQRRGQFRDLVVDSLPTREWRVIHGIYWKNERPSELATRIHLTKRRVNQIRAGALEQLRLTLRKMGVVRANYKEWYYEL